MKIRNGFVSNSSSSSFILAKPKKYLSLNEIVDFYGITDEYGEEFRDSVAAFIYLSLQTTEPSDVSSHFENLFDKSNIEWLRKIGYGHDDEWYEKAKRNLTDYSNHIEIGVGNDIDCYSELKIPFDLNYDMDMRSENIFTKPEHAIGLSYH